MEIIISIIGKLGEILIEPIGRQCGYLKHYNNNIETLEEQVEILEGLRKDVETDIDEAKRKGEKIRNQVQEWIERVQKNLSEAEEILQSAAKAKFHNVASRYELSKKAEKKTAAVKEMKEDGKFDRVSNPAPPPKTTFPANEDFVIFERNEKIMMEIMEALKGNEINFIGIYGMGGVGKTTLVKEIARHAQQENIFDNVSMAVVSHTVDLKNIQDQIAEMLDLKLDEKKTVQVRAMYLRNQLEDKKVLIILDDIWRRLQLEEVGIPFGSKGCKVIVTTRRKQVCNTMANTESKTAKIIHLDVLSSQESWTLLQKNTGDDIESPTIKSSAEQICAECNGLPIALVTVGRAMSRKSPNDWKAAALELKKSRPGNIEGVEEEVYKSLKLSYDYLKGEESKSILKLCCLFPEDFDIDVEDLVRYGFGMGIFEDIVRIQEVRKRTHLIINNLKDSCLLLQGKSIDEVKMHDVVRDVLKSMTSDIYFVKKGKEDWPNMEKLKHFICISAIGCSFLSHPDAWDCSNLQIWLMHRNFRPLSSRDEIELIPIKVLKGMRALKVLDNRARAGVPKFFLFSPFRMKALDPAFGCLTNLRTLIFKNYDLQNITVLSELKLLQILCLNGCKSEEPLSGIGELINLQLLDLGRHYFTIPQNVISRLHQLQELHIYPPFLFNAQVFNIAELKSLAHLTTLWIEVKDFESIPQGFIFSELEDFQISVGEAMVDEHERTIKGMNCLSVYGSRGSSAFDEEKMLAYCFMSLLPRTNHLSLSRFKNLGSILTSLNFKRLYKLEVRDCAAIEYIFEEKNMAPYLERLHLVDVKGLKQIWKGYVEDLGNLQSTVIGDCHELNVMFHASIAQGLVKLETVRLYDCHNLEAIVAKDQEEGTDQRDLIFPHLRQLSLSRLPKLAAICIDKLCFKWPSLETVVLHDCPNMKTFAATVASDGDKSTPSLKRITVDDHTIKLDGTELNKVIQDHYKNKGVAVSPEEEEKEEEETEKEGGK